jgi:hypothetical protein
MPKRRLVDFGREYNKTEMETVEKMLINTVNNSKKRLLTDMFHACSRTIKLTLVDKANPILKIGLILVRRIYERSNCKTSKKTGQTT